MIFITGAAGFIGRATRDALRHRGERAIVAVDNAPVTGYNAHLTGADFRAQLVAGDFNHKPPQAIFHFAAVDSRAPREQLIDTNVTFSQEIIRWCTEHKVRCIYASTCSVYGRDSYNSTDNHDSFENFTPINAYAESKLSLDIWARDAGYLEHVVGLRYFSVYGPGQTASSMSGGSFILKQFPNLMQHGYVEVFADGEATRDLVYIKDILAIHLFFLDQPTKAGIYNIGSGQARSFNDAALAMFDAVGKDPHIRYLDMPPGMQSTWIDSMQADITKLRAAGYTSPITTLESGTRDYLLNHLLNIRC
ncbi:MAG: NAD-dependent epimerase/dehydratase family protein [Candidatus Andersenbacteria bacterium]|nr:NAD-dependent epimerase/dehydratase family protein [Candidatus Andersenbacteria bacterium]